MDNFTFALKIIQMCNWTTSRIISEIQNGSDNDNIRKYIRGEISKLSSELKDLVTDDEVNEIITGRSKKPI